MITIETPTLISSHYPLPARITLDYEHIGKTLTINVLHPQTSLNVTLHLVINDMIVYADLTGVLKTMFDHKEPESLERLFQMKRQKLHPITIIASVEDDQATKEAYVYQSIENYTGRYVTYFRLSPNQNRESVTFFKGFPQLDMFLIRSENTNNSPTATATFPAETYEYLYLLRNDTEQVPGTNLVPRNYVQREVDECGIFIRWRNTHGGWSYWLFSEEYTEEVKTKQLGKVNRFVKEEIDLPYRLYHLGFKATKQWTLQSKIPILDNELEEIKTLLVSPEIYLFTGQQYSHEREQFLPKNWERVSIAEGSQRLTKNAHATHSITVTIEFQDEKTLTVI